MLLLIQIEPTYAQPILSKTTENDISFNNLPWYIDYVTIHEKTNNYPFAYTHFSERISFLGYWNKSYDGLWDFEKNTENCGGSIVVSNLTVAGYKTKFTELFFMWNIEGHLYENYNNNGFENADEALFYAASYTLDIIDDQSCYEDIKEKLINKYGDKFYSGKSKDGEKAYTFWVDTHGAIVAVTNHFGKINIYYIAPNAEDRLNEVKEAVKKQMIEIEHRDAKDNMTGL